MTTLLIRPSEITQFTPMGGNVDIDKYTPCIFDVQVMVIEPLLGKKLYDKILSEFEANTLTGKYLELYDDYLKPILRHQVFAEYVEIGSYTVANAGIFKHQPENSEVVSKGEVQFLAQTARTKAQTYIERAERWLRGSGISEYSGNCGGGDVKVSMGWLL